MDRRFLGTRVVMDKIDEIFSEWVALRGFGDSTRITYGAMFNVVCAWLYEHNTNIQDVSAEILERFFSSRGVSAGTERRYLMLLRDYFDYLIILRVVNDNPAQSLLTKQKRKPRAEPPTRTVPVSLTEDEVQRLLEALSASTGHFAEIRRRTLIIVMLCCGLSAQEVCDLRWTSIFLTQEMELRLPGGRRTRRVPLTSVAASALLEWKKLAGSRSVCDGQADQFVFVKGKDRRPYKPSGIYRLVLAGMKMAGIEKDRISPKTLRSTFAARNLSEGVPLETVQLWLGHGSAATTAIYKRENDANQLQPTWVPV